MNDIDTIKRNIEKKIFDLKYMTQVEPINKDTMAAYLDTVEIALDNLDYMHTDEECDHEYCREDWEVSEARLEGAEDERDKILADLRLRCADHPEFLTILDEL